MMHKKGSLRFQAVQIIEKSLARLQEQRLVLGIFGRTGHARLRRHNERRHFPRRNVFSHFACLDPAGERGRHGLSPRDVGVLQRLAEFYIKGRHLLRQIIQRTAMHQPGVGNRPFGALAKDALQIGNWIGRIGERIGPLLREIRMNDLPHNRESQIFFALEVMKERAFSRARFINDPIETTALESVFVKFVESSLEDFSSRVFWRSGVGRFHSIFEDTDQSVCVNAQIFSSNVGHTIGN